MKIIKINTEFIKLQQILKLAGITVNGSDIKYFISENLVKINGEIINQRGKKVRNNDIVEIIDVDIFKVKQI